MKTDHLRVANGRQHDLDSAVRDSLLDEEIISRLEHPGRWLGPIDGPRVEPAHATRAVLLWPSAPERITVPSGIAPIWSRLRASDLSVSVAYAPTDDLTVALSERDQTLFTPGDWRPLTSFASWWVWVEEPTQVLGLLSSLQAARLAPWPGQRDADDPLVVAAGPAARVAPELLRAFADVVVPTADPDEVCALIASLAEADPRAAAAGWIEAGRALRASDGVPVELAAPSLPDLRTRIDSHLPPVHRGQLSRPSASCHRGVNGAPLTTIWLWAADAGLRQRWSDLADDEVIDWIREALDHPAGQILLKLAIGLPGEGSEHRAAVVDLIHAVVEAAPRGAKQLRVELHLYARDAAEAKEWGRPTVEDLTRWRDQVVDGLRVPKLRLTATDPARTFGASLFLSEAPLLPALALTLQRAGVHRAESELAQVADLWHKALEVGKIFPPDHSGSDLVATSPAAVGPRINLELQDGDGPSDSSRASLPADPQPRAGGAAGVDKWTRWSDLARRYFEFRLEYSKRGRLRLLGHRELVDIFMRAFHAAQLPIATSGVVQPRPRVSFGPPLPVGVEGLREYVDVGLTRKVTDLSDRLHRHLPEGLGVVRTRFVPLPPGRTSLGLVASADYEAVISARHWRAQPRTASDLDARFAALCASESTSADDPALNIEQVIRFTASDDADGLRLTFRLDLSPAGPKCKPLELLAALLEDSIEDVRSILMRRTHLLTKNPLPHRPLLSPMEQLAAAERHLRDRARWCA